MAQCPKCGETSADATVICPGCDYILDAAFLGDDILNEITGQQKPVQLPISSAGDAVVLGGIDEPFDLMFSEATGSFLTADTQDVDRHVVQAPVYVAKSVQELMKPEAVLAPAPDIDKRKAMLSPFELHVLSFIDGVRPVARLRKKTGLTGDDLRIAVGMLAEKKAVVLQGVVAPPDMKNLLAGELSSDDQDPIDDDPIDDMTHEDASLPGFGATKRTGEMQPLPLDGDLAPDVPAHEPAPSPWTQPRTNAPPPPAKSAVPAGMGRPRGIAAPPADAAAMERTAKAATFFDLAHEELNKGNRVRAHVYAKLAAETNPDEPKYQELLRTWSIASRTSTSLDASLFADADVAEKQGNHHRALALMQQALDANPDAAHIHNRMALLLATRFKKFSQASEHLMKACTLEPNNVVYKNNLGKIIALADERGARMGAPDGKPGKGFLGKLKKALE